jgi:hypothetical protein
VPFYLSRRVIKNHYIIFKNIKREKIKNKWTQAGLEPAMLKCSLGEKFEKIAQNRKKCHFLGPLCSRIGYSILSKPSYKILFSLRYDEK